MCMLQLYGDLQEVSMSFVHPMNESIPMFYSVAWDWRRDLWCALELLGAKGECDRHSRCLKQPSFTFAIRPVVIAVTIAT